MNERGDFTRCFDRSIPTNTVQMMSLSSVTLLSRQHFQDHTLATRSSVTLSDIRAASAIAHTDLIKEVKVSSVGL
jgi:hypothetical protein